MLIGGYDSANLNDQDIISKVFGETYATLQEKFNLYLIRITKS